MKFEENMKALAEIAEKLEAGSLPLEDAIALYGDGVRLAKACQEELEQASLVVKEYGKSENAEAER